MEFIDNTYQLPVNNGTQALKDQESKVIPVLKWATNLVKKKKLMQYSSAYSFKQLYRPGGVSIEQKVDWNPKPM